MRRATLGLTAVAILMLPMTTAPAAAQNSPRAAENMCKDNIRRNYGVSNFQGVTSSDRGGNRYIVNGNAERGNETAYFTCRAQYGSTSISMGNWNRKSGGSGGAVAAVGVAIALGAIIAAASSKHKSHEYDNYDNGGNNNNYGGDNSYSPARNVTCYRDQRACFDDRNNYLASWTSREFGY